MHLELQCSGRLSTSGNTMLNLICKLSAMRGVKYMNEFRARYRRGSKVVSTATVQH